MILQTKTVLPAEWSQQDGILLCWPHKSTDWQALLAEVEPVFDQLVKYICQHQKLILIAHDENHQIAIKKRLSHKNINTSAIQWLIHPNNDTWCRDYGPITVIKNDHTHALDFGFNGWGNKFAHDQDDQTNKKLKQNGLLTCNLESIDLILEGGSIESDGQGTLLTTEHCLLSPMRNPQLDKQQIEALLSEQLGIDHFLWLSHGYLEGDDTDSHVDNLARFCNETTIAYASCHDKTDIHYQALKEMENELKAFRTRDDKAYTLIPLSIPKAIFEKEQRLPASYVNFLITNDYVLMPTFKDEQDLINKEKLQSVFTDRNVIGIPSQDIIRQYGSIHCLSMQLPVNTLNTEN